MKKRKLPSLGAGSMADVAFLLLIFFLVTTTIQTDAGIQVLLPAWTDQKIIDRRKNNNVLSVLINANNELMVEDKAAKLSDLKFKIEQLVLEEAESPKKAVVSLQNHERTAYNTYIAVYNEIKAGYHKIWDDVAVRQYGQPYDDLMESLQQKIRKNYPLVISEVEPSAVAMKQ